MTISLYPVCHRGRSDCDPISCIAAAPNDITEEQSYTREFTPLSFVCSGVAKSQEFAQDQYRLCFKNKAVDDISDNDMQDLTSLMVVVSSALSLDAIRKMNSGVAHIPSAHVTDGVAHSCDDHKWIEVENEVMDPHLMCKTCFDEKSQIKIKPIEG